jgi:hypothetical protein
MRLFELILDIRPLSFKVILFVKSRKDYTIIDTKLFIMRIRTRINRLDIFFIIFCTTNI